MQLEIIFLMTSYIYNFNKSIQIIIAFFMMVVNFLMTIIVVIITLSICSIAYKIIICIAPWMLGKRQKSL